MKYPMFFYSKVIFTFDELDFEHAHQRRTKEKEFCSIVLETSFG